MLISKCSNLLAHRDPSMNYKAELFENLVLHHVVYYCSHHNVLTTAMLELLTKKNNKARWYRVVQSKHD